MMRKTLHSETTKNFNKRVGLEKHLHSCLKEGVSWQAFTGVVG